MRAIAGKPILNDRVLTPARREILVWLGEHKFATSSQLWQELMPAKSRIHVLNELARLRELELVRGVSLNPELGGASELCWQLRKAGAKAANISFGSQHARLPTPELVRAKDMQLKLVREVEYAEWLLAKPFRYSPTRPLPEYTPQYHILAQVLETTFRKDIERIQRGGQLDRQQIINFEDREYLRLIPKQNNDYLAYQPDSSLAIIFILCPPGSGSKFWRQRLAKYQRLLKYIPVYGVFENQAQSQTWQKQFGNNGIKNTALEGIYGILRAIEG